MNKTSNLRTKRILASYAILATLFVAIYLVDLDLKGEYTLGIIIVMSFISVLLPYVMVRSHDQQRSLGVFLITSALSAMIFGALPTYGYLSFLSDFPGVTIWVIMLNGLTAGAIVGLVVGTVFNILRRGPGVSDSTGKVLGVFMFIFFIGTGIWSSIATVDYDGRYLWEIIKQL